VLYTPFPVQISGRDLEEPSLGALKHKKTILKLTICIRGTNASTLDLEEAGVDALQDMREAAHGLMGMV